MSRHARAAEPVPGLDAWRLLKHARLGLGGAWPPSAHVRASNEYLRLDALDVPVAEKIDALRQWLGRLRDPDRVAVEFAGIERVATRYGGGGPPKRLRLTDPPTRREGLEQKAQ